MEFNKSLRLGEEYYNPTITDKKTIILRHTSGTSAKQEVKRWKHTPGAIGAAFIVERDGTVYQIFEPRYWAYGLGISGIADFEKQTIQIALVSCGEINKIQFPGFGEYYYYYLPLNPNPAGAMKIPDDEILKLDFREGKYFHKYPEKQVKSTIELVKYLMDEFQIKIQHDFEDFWEYNEQVIPKKLSGIYSHTSLNKDKKDIFPQEDLILGLKSLKSKNPKSSITSSNL